MWYLIVLVMLQIKFLEDLLASGHKALHIPLSGILSKSVLLLFPQLGVPRTLHFARKKRT